jgi:hypothetical protein
MFYLFMSRHEDKANYSAIKLCYNCNNNIFDRSIKYCPKCHVDLNPNDLKWRKSFILFLILLLLIPIILVVYKMILN